MKRTAKSALVFALTASMVLGNASISDAKAKKPKLSKSKLTLTVGKSAKITVKKAKPKKTTWSLTKKGKKIVSLKKKKKKSVTIKAKKAGKATLTAKIKVGKKTYKKKVRITVKKKSVVKPSATTGTKVTPSPTQGGSGGGSTASNSPSASATATATATATASPTPSLPDNYKPVLLSEDTEFAKGGIDEEVGVTYGADGSATFTALTAYSGGGLIWYINKDKTPINLDRYEQVIFNVSAKFDPEVNTMGAPVCLELIKNPEPKNGIYELDSIPNYKTIEESETPTEFAIDLNSTDDVYGVMVKYNTWTENDDFGGEEAEFTVHSITFVEKENYVPSSPTPTPTATATATATPTATATATATTDAGVKLDLSKAVTIDGGVAVPYDPEKGLTVKDTKSFKLALPKEVNADEAVTVKVKGKLNDGDFRAYLIHDVDAALSNIVKTTDDASVTTGEFEWEFTLNATAPANGILFKGIDWQTPIKDLEITEVSVILPQEEQPTVIEPTVVSDSAVKVKLSKDTEYASGSVENITYDAENGSASYVAKTQYAGGGVAWWVNEDKSPIKVSDFKTLTIRVKSSEAGTPVVLNMFSDNSASWWSAPTLDLDGRYSATSATAGDVTTFTFDLSKVKDQTASIYAVCLKYNAYGQEDTLPSTTMTFESIEFEKKVTTVSYVYSGLDADAEYAITSNGNTTNVAVSDIIENWADKVVNVDNAYTKWTATNEIEMKLGDATITAIATDDNETRTVVVNGTNTAKDGSYQVSMNKKDGAYSIQLEKTTGETGTFDIAVAADKVTASGSYDNKPYDIAIGMNADKKATSISVASGDVELVKVTKNDDGTYSIAVDKAEADKRGLTIAK